MKLSTALIISSIASVASAQSIRSEKAKASLLNKSRRLEQNQQGDDAYGFLSSYALKLIGCASGEKYTDPQTNEVEYSTVIFRLCPVDSCDDASAGGCKKGYGDFAVGLGTFVKEWLEDKRENMQQDDMFKVEQLGECREYKVDNDAQDGEENAVYYVGPACGTEKAEIVVGLFSDETCTTPSSKTFEEISNGWALPYSTSGAGLVTNACEMCSGYDAQGNFGVSQMCTTVFEGASQRCMTNMETTNSNGADESGCSYIQSLIPKTKSSKAGAAVGWTIFALVIVGAAAYGYTKWWLKKKQASSLASDGM